jgi:hypothetical protein
MNRRLKSYFPSDNGRRDHRGHLYYRSRCWGMDACAAAKAESHEPNKPNETQ